MVSLARGANYSHHWTAMAAASFCPSLPQHFKPVSISKFPQTSFSFKVFSSQSSAPKGPDENPTRLGFLGLGIMGSPMAHNLLKAGCDVTVWNRTKSKCDPLIDLGAKYKPSPAEVAASCDITFAMLADPESAMVVACGEDGAASGMGTGKGYVDISTVDGATSKLINEQIKETGALFLEAPVSGSKKPAEDGQLIFLTAGDVGNGAAMKLVVNMIMGSMMTSFAEGLLLGEKVGLDPNVVVECTNVLNERSFNGAIQIPYCFSFEASAEAESVSQSTPIAAAANELYKVAKSHGLSDHDFSAVIEALK
ncbi:3-hydroxyisobutyrate dehydrogenase-related, conserved site-containing protein, partial [Cynara cardunculus var. scolymus]